MKTNLEKMDLTMYYEKLDNGLDVYIVPFDKVPSRFAKIFSWLAFTYQRMFVYRYEKDSAVVLIFRVLL